VSFGIKGWADSAGGKCWGCADFIRREEGGRPEPDERKFWATAMAEKPRALLALARALLFDVMRDSAKQGLLGLNCIYLQCPLVHYQGSGEPVVWK
jgi:hypothetical protein